MKIFQKKIPQGSQICTSTKEDAETTSYLSSFKLDGKKIKTRSLSGTSLLQTSNKVQLRTDENNNSAHAHSSCCEKPKAKEIKARSRNCCSKCEKNLCNCGLKWKEGALFFPDYFPQTLYDDVEFARGSFILSNPTQQENASNKQNSCPRDLHYTNSFDVELIASWMRYFGYKDSKF